MKLNLGAGNKQYEGWINCDKSPDVNPDRVIDLEKPLPFDDNSIEKINCEHTLEHINNFVPLVHELIRICKPGARIFITTPFYSAWGQYNDPTHVRFFTPWTFNYFKKGNYSHEVGVKESAVEVKYVRLHFGIGKSKCLNWLIDPWINLWPKFYCRFMAWVFPCAEIEYLLEVKK